MFVWPECQIFIKTASLREAGYWTNREYGAFAALGSWNEHSGNKSICSNFAASIHTAARNFRAITAISASSNSSAQINTLRKLQMAQTNPKFQHTSPWPLFFFFFPIDISYVLFILIGIILVHWIGDFVKFSSTSIKSKIEDLINSKWPIANEALNSMNKSNTKKIEGVLN